MILSACGGARSVDPPATEAVFRYALLDNPAFDEANARAADPRGLRPIPWWGSARGMDQVKSHADAHAVELMQGDWIRQPLAFYAPLSQTLVVSGRMDAVARLSLISGDGRELPVAEHMRWSDDGTFELRARDLPSGSVVPRLELRVSPAAGASTTRVHALAAHVDLPCPTEAALRAEIVAQLKEIFGAWLTRGIDDVGPRKTGFLAKDFDAVTGAVLRTSNATGFSSFYQALLDAALAADVPEWRAAFDRFFEDFLQLQLHPATGLPRSWNPVTDTALDDTPTEIALAFGFLIDVAERGPEKFRARAKAAATKIGETVLAHGLIPDGNCAASYWPATGAPNLNVNQLRRLDVPLQLVRLSKLTEDPRFAAAAREPLVTLEFTHFWHGVWFAIDPGFDDDFGHYGARAARVAREAPDETYYRRFALEGWKHYEPMWRDALRCGGNIAADQVRCWKIGVDLARVEPELRRDMGPLLRLAARSHFKGEQYGNGAWGDVTIFDFHPNDALQVGDLTGAPQNLLTGLASIYVEELGLRTDEIRAMYTAVLRSSVAQYRRPHGFLLDRNQGAGANSAYGSIRVLGGLVEMLTALSRPR
ncbi:MAG: hypothetical protein JNL28_16735 [Planctomycetes bacterium]|nr:hypothetical protein [Planctomycetota bacterium]